MTNKPEQIARSVSEPSTESFDVPVVSEQVYKQTKEAVEKAGYSFFVKIKPESVADILEEDEKCAARDEERIFEVDGVDPSVEMRKNIPPEIEIAINPTGAKIEKSHALNTEGHKRIIAEEGDLLAESIPDGLRGFVSVRMPIASIAVQINQAYKEKFGKSLFNGWFTRTDDLLSPEKGLARVGRYATDKGMRVRGPDDRKDVNDVYAMAIVILPGKICSNH